MASTTNIMTVEQFRRLPENGPFYYELRRGEPIPVTRPKFKHFRIQKQLEQLLEQAAGGLGVVTMEFAFRPLPEYELRVADVAYVTRERWERTDPEDNLRGAPELVVEVLSPSNTVAEINEKEELCLENGSLQFWVVDADLRQVKVSRPDGITTTYHSNQEIPLDILGGGMLPVAAIFS